MDSFMSFLENKMMPPMMKLGNQRHLIAIRNGLVITLPAIIGGEFIFNFGEFTDSCLDYFFKTLSRVN